MTPLDKIACAISGAPYPTDKSRQKARAALLALSDCAKKDSIRDWLLSIAEEKSDG